MIKKIFAVLGIILILIVGYFANEIYFNPKSPKGVATYEKDDLKIEVVYHRPYKKDRLIFGQAEDQALVPFGQYWRLGANAATSFETSQEIAFAGRTLAAGKYSMYAIPHADHWVVVLNKETRILGYTEPDYEKDIMRVNISTAKLLTPVDPFTIELVEDEESLALHMRWDYTSVAIPLN